MLHARMLTRGSILVLRDHPACQPDKGEISIDTLSFTIDLSVIFDYCVGSELIVMHAFDNPTDDENWFLWLAFQKFITACFGPAIAPEADFKPGRNFFKWSLPLNDRSGFIAFGGNNKIVDHTGKERSRPERMQVYLSGEGCSKVKDWRFLHSFLKDSEIFAPKITRVDIAYDDHEGQRDVEFAVDSYSAGLFAGNGRPPKGQRIDDMGSGDGCTFYVGSRESGRYLRIYEKGKQLGDKSSPWVRWEVELSSKQVDVPLCVLIMPRQYLAGSYPCLDWVSRARLVIKTAQRREKIEFAHLVNHGRRGYGALINYMLSRKGMTPDQIVNDLIRDGVPGRLIWTTTTEIEAYDLSSREINPHLYSIEQPHWSNTHA